MNQTQSFTSPSTTIRFPSPALPEPGRPSLRTPQVVETICAYIRVEGVSDSMAGMLAGISTTSLSRWKQGDEDFALEIGRARALFAMERLREIREARKRDGTLDWRAQAWLLQNSSPDGYGRPSRRRKAKHEQPGDEEDGSPERIEVTTEELEHMVMARVQEVLRLQLETASGPEEQDHPETPDNAEAAEDSGEPDWPAAAPETPNLPEIPETPRPRPLSRRERRAEERRFAREARQTAHAA